MMSEMRRSDRATTCQEAEALLERCLYGALSTVCEDGQPYAVPISYAYDAAGGRIVFHCAPDVGQKVENLRHDARACFTVVGDVETLPSKFSTNYESAVVLGRAREITDLDKKKAALHLLIDKYSDDFQEKGAKYIDSAAAKTGVYEITVEQITGKARR